MGNIAVKSVAAVVAGSSVLVGSAIEYYHSK